MTRLDNILPFAHRLWAAWLPEGGCAVDATAQLVADYSGMFSAPSTLSGGKRGIRVAHENEKRRRSQACHGAKAV